MLPTLPALEPPHIDPISIVIKQEAEPPKEQLYTIKEGDTLTAIAEATHTSVERLWQKNTELTNPDLIEPDKPLKIPQDDEVLTPREMPATIQSALPYTVGANAGTAVTGGSSSSRGSSGRFVYGWCTWLADQLRPDIHATGNAGEWIRYANSRTPSKGAIAVNTWAAGGYGHVAYVVDFNATQVLVRHMNWRGFGKDTTDWVDRGYWAGYIL